MQLIGVLVGACTRLDPTVELNRATHCHALSVLWVFGSQLLVLRLANTCQILFCHGRRATDFVARRCMYAVLRFGRR